MLLIFCMLAMTFIRGSLDQTVTCDIEKQTADCSFRFLKEVPQDLPISIITLILRDNHIKLIPSAFQRYKHLRHLDLAHNELNTFGNDTFDGLHNLVTLNLEGNNLDLTSAVYRPGVFFGLSRLETLNIGGNFDALRSEIDFSYPDQALRCLTSIKNLTIDGVPGEMFGKGFSVLQNLSTVTFGKHCSIYYINESMFDYTSFLIVLDMSDCHISDIHRNAFSRLPRIDTLDLSRNRGLGFDNAVGAFYGLQNTSIRVLRINNIVLPYQIDVVPPRDSLRYLQNTSIKELYIDHNNIEILQPGTFDFFPKTLEFVSCRDNRFTVGFYVFEFQKIKGLKKVDLSDMAIGHYLKLPELTNDNINWPDLPIPLPTAPDVEDVIIRNSIIHAGIPSVRFMPNKVKRIDISQNGINIWKGPIRGLNALKMVDISRNFCSKIYPCFFNHMRNLTFLNASDNFLGEALQEYHYVFSPLQRIETLDLSKNRFQKFHKDTFQTNTQLKHLILSDNQIYDGNFEMSQFTNLEILDLCGNDLRYLHATSRYALDTLSKRKNISIDLSNNPISCTCENIIFLQWMLNTRVTFLKVHEYTCVDNNGEKQILDRKLIETMLSRCTSHLIIMIGSGSVFIFLLSLILCGTLYRYRWKLKYLYYVARDRYISGQGRHHTERRHFEYDAFVSFDNEDIEFVSTLMERLEGEQRRLCVHHRDFRPGEPIGANIVRAVQTSRRSVLVLSRNFLTSNWCRYEFEMARMESVYEERRVIIVLKIEDIDDADLPRELLYMMKSNSYLEWPDSVEEQETFWFSLDKVIADD